MKLLLVSLLVALPALALGELPVSTFILNEETVKQCAIDAGIKPERYEYFKTLSTISEASKDEKCTMMKCNLQMQNIIRDGVIDYTALASKFKTNMPRFPAKSAAAEYLKCTEKPDEAIAKDICDQINFYLNCLFYTALKYTSPLLESTTASMRHCQTENNVSEDEVTALDYKADAPKSREGKCMLACLLKDKGAVFEGKLDADYIQSKLVNDAYESRVSRYAPSVEVIEEDYKKCSPKVTDPTGSKDLCEGAYDLYDCMFKVEKKYYPKGTANN